MVDIKFYKCSFLVYFKKNKQIIANSVFKQYKRDIQSIFVYF